MTEPERLAREVAADRELLEASIRRLRRTLAALADDGISHSSALPGWRRAHVLSHLARAADARTGLLAAARAGRVGRQYPSEESRAADIEAGARRPAAAIRADLCESLSRFTAAAASHPAGLWDAEGEWLDGRRRPVRRVVPGLRAEIEYHHVDLKAGFEPACWPAEFVNGELRRVTEAMSARPGVPPVTIEAPDETLRIGDGSGAEIAGDASDLLAWLTGRGDGGRLRVRPAGPLPALPPLG